MCTYVYLGTITVGYKTLANTDSLYGVNRDVLQSEVNRTTETFQSKLSDSGRVTECEKKKVSFLSYQAHSNAECWFSEDDHLTMWRLKL